MYFVESSWSGLFLSLNIGVVSSVMNLFVFGLTTDEKLMIVNTVK